MTHIALVGASGFVGSAVRCALDRHNLPWSPVPRIQLDGVGLPDSPSAADIEAAVKDALTDNNDWQRHVEDCMREATVVINAAGLAAPTSNDRLSLWSTNVLLPAVLAELARRNGVQRLVHVSSAAVQGNNATLTETWDTSPRSDYAESKASAEQYLRYISEPQTVVYRATSVMGGSRDITQSLVRLFGGRLSLLIGKGEAPLPLASVDNTADAIVRLAIAQVAPSLVLHPWEGVTQRSLADCLRSADSKRVRIPIVGVAAKTLAKMSGLPAPAGPLVRRVDLFVNGQAQDCVSLERMGWEQLDDVHEVLKGLSSAHH